MQVARGRMHYILLHPTLNRRHSRGKDTSVSLSVVAAALPWNRRRGDFGHLQPAPAEAAAELASIHNECQRRSQIWGCRAMTQMQQMERAMLEQSNRKRATILAKTAVAIVAAANAGAA
jgi:hypothetical protein